MIEILSPTRIKLHGYEARYQELQRFLTFTDTSVAYQIKRFKHARWFVNKFGEEMYQEKLQELKDSEKVCLLDVNFETYSGLLQDLREKLGNPPITRKWSYPPYKPLVWYNEPSFNLRDYQQEAAERLLAVGHGSVSLPTGSGKSAVIREITKVIGLKTVIMAPSVSIARQLYDDFKVHFGPRFVGLYGNGKKEFKKRVVIAISKSLDSLEENTEAWEHLSQANVFIADESHLCPAETLKKVCLGVLGKAEYRFFVSATQMRNDGADLLLKAIIGPLVLTKSAVELINAGYLAKPNFLIRQFESASSYASADILKMLHHHHYNNRPLHQDAAELANKLVSVTKHQVLIMVDHIEQFQYLQGHLRHKFAFAHGGVSKLNRSMIPEAYWKSDPTKLVKEFNDGKLPILIGTGCISIGTDIRPVNSIINLQAGKSEIKFLQLVGRGTRCTPDKKEFNFIDYGIMSVPALKNHLFSRIKIYKNFYDNVKYI